MEKERKNREKIEKSGRWKYKIWKLREKKGWKIR